MNLHLLIRECINPALEFLPANFDSLNARILMGATCIQESDLIYRRQVKGPAVSFAQFERIGIKDVLERPTSAKLAAEACKFHNTAPTVNAVYERFKTPEGDILAMIFTRLNYWNNTKPLPQFNSRSSEPLFWDYYKTTWRPGKPHLDRWPRSFWRAYGAFEG